MLHKMPVDKSTPWVSF